MRETRGYTPPEVENIDKSRRTFTLASLAGLGLAGLGLRTEAGKRFMGELAKMDASIGGHDMTLKGLHGEQDDSIIDQFEQFVQPEKIEDHNMEDYDHALDKEFIFFTEREAEKEEGFDYEGETLVALKAEKYHLWDSRMDKLFRNDKANHEKYYTEFLKKSKEERKDFLSKLDKICDDFEVPVSVALGVMMTETKGNHENNVPVGGWKNLRKGPQGIMQISDDAEKLVKRVFGDRLDDFNRHDLWGNIKLGIAYLKLMNKYYGGQWGMACAAYSGGMGKIDRRIMEEMPEEFHDELNRRKDNPIDGEGAVWTFQRKKIIEFLDKDNAGIPKAYASKEKGGWGWDEKKWHSSQYPFFVAHSGKTAYSILSSKDENPDIGPFFASKEEELECKNLREGKPPIKVAKR